MIPTRASAVLSSAVLLTLVACGGGGGGTESLGGAVAIDGSSTVFPIAEAVAEEFQIANPNVRVTVGFSGSGGGFERFCAGETDISNASRPINPREVEACAGAGISFTEVSVAWDGLSVIVLMIFAIPLMDGVVARAIAEPGKLAGFIAGAFAGMVLCNLIVTTGCLPFLPRREALTAGYCSGGRHNALLMAVLPASADPDIFLFIAAVQFPLYLMPTLLEPVYRRLSRM